MTRDEFTKYVETYGADLSRWPDDVQSKSQALIASDPSFAHPLLEEARKLDTALESARLAPGTDMLKARILNEVGRQQPSTQQHAANDHSSQGLKYRTVAAMMAISFVLGFAGANYMQAAPVVSDDQILVDNEWQELADDYGMSDVYEWVGRDAAP